MLNGRLQWTFFLNIFFTRRFAVDSQLLLLQITVIKFDNFVTTISQARSIILQEKKIYIRNTFFFLSIIGKKERETSRIILSKHDFIWTARSCHCYQLSQRWRDQQSSPSTPFFFISPNRHPERVYIYIYINTRFSKATHGHVSLSGYRACAYSSHGHRHNFPIRRYV